MSKTADHDMSAILVNGDVDGFMAEIAHIADVIETFDAGQFGKATLARLGRTVIISDDQGHVSLHGHDDTVEAVACFDDQVNHARAALASLPTPEDQAMASDLSRQVMSGELTLTQAVQAMQAVRAARQGGQMPAGMAVVAGEPVPRTGMYI